MWISSILFFKPFKGKFKPFSFIFGSSWPISTTNRRTKLLFNGIMLIKLAWSGNLNNFQIIGPLGRCFLKVEMSVRLSVCLSVLLCVCSLLRYRLTVFLPPLPEVGCPIFLEIWNPRGKVMERSGLTFEHLCLEMI